MTKKTITEKAMQLVNGGLAVQWDLIGCDYPYYAPGVDGETSNDITYKILEEAINIVRSHQGLPPLLVSVYDVFEDAYRQQVGTIADMKRCSYDHIINKNAEPHYHRNDLRGDTVISFKTSFAKALNPNE